MGNAKKGKKIIKTQSPKNKKQGFPLTYKIILALILVLTLIVFSTSLKNEFIINWDDDGYVLNNPTIQHLDKGSVKEIFTSFHMGNFHPLTTLTYALEYKWFKVDPKPYHALNLILHLCNVLLVFFFIRALSKKNLVALITCALFAIHPMHVESVAWISELKDVLYTFFFLLSLLLYTRFSQNKKTSLYILSLLMFVLSLLSKSAAVVLPVVLLLIDFFQNRKPDLKSIILKLPYFLLALVFGIIALKSQDAQTQQLTPVYTALNSFFVGMYALGFYIFKFFLPFQLSAFYPHPVMGSSTLPHIYYLSPLLIAGFIYLTHRVVKDKKLIIFGFLFLIVTIGLVLQFFPVGGAIVAERYTYVPYIGLAFMLAVFLEKVYMKQKDRQAMLTLVFVLVVFAFSVLSFNRNKVWANGLTLFDDVIEKQPEAFYAYHSRGIVYYYQGNYNASLMDYNKAIALNNNYGLTFYNKGLTEMMLKQNAEAYKSFSSTIKLIPNNDQAYNDRAIANYNLNNFDEAINDYSKSISLNPQNTKAYYNRGAAYFRTNDMVKACADWQKASEMGLKQADEMIMKHCNN